VEACETAQLLSHAACWTVNAMAKDHAKKMTTALPHGVGRWATRASGSALAAIACPCRNI
jgi:hypothetical protein